MSTHDFVPDKDHPNLCKDCGKPRPNTDHRRLPARPNPLYCVRQ